MELNNRNTVIIIVAIVCVTFVLGTGIYLNGNGNMGNMGNLNPFEEKEPIHIINATFSTEHSLDAKSVCTINVGLNHSAENISVEILYSRDGKDLNDGDRSLKTVSSDGSIVCESEDSFSKYPDRAIIRLYDDEGNTLDSADVSLATDDSIQLAIGNGTVKAKAITKAEHSASTSATSASSDGVTEWVEDLDLSDKAGYDCHVYIHHRSDGIKYYYDSEGKIDSAPESEEWVF